MYNSKKKKKKRVVRVFGKKLNGPQSKYFLDNKIFYLSNIGLYTDAHFKCFVLFL